MDNKRRAQKRERAAASEIGGRAHPGSGSVWYQKGDCSNENWVIEDKFTDSNLYSIKYATLLTLAKQAHKIGKTPIFRFGFDKFHQNYVLVATSDYNDYIPETYSKLSTNKKSYSISITSLSSMHVKAPAIILSELTFDLFKKSYLLLTWDDFIANQTKFSAA